MSRNFEILRQTGKEIELFRTPEIQVECVEVIPRGRAAESEWEVFATPRLTPATRLWAFLVVVATGLGMAIYIHKRHIPLSAEQQVQTVEGTTFEGVIKPAHDVKVAAAVTGVVERVTAKLGDRVEEGQVLLVMENRELDMEVDAAKLEQTTTAQEIAQLEASLAGPETSLATQLAEANGRVSVLERRVQQVPTPERSESPERARAVYEQALAAFKRSEALQKEGLTSEQQFEDARAAVQIAKDDLNVALKAEAAEQALGREQESQARLQVEVIRHQQRQQLQELRLRYRKATQALETAQQRRAEGLVKATSAGVLVELPVKPGDQVASGMMLARVAQLDVMLVEVEVAARLVNALHVRQRAQVALPTVPPREIEGVVTTISPLPAADMNHTLEVEFRNTAETLWVDQPAQVRFLPD
jgi:multidrug efflux pump subunit AcrA (membrane-fusion protein)